MDLYLLSFHYGSSDLHVVIVHVHIIALCRVLALQINRR